MESKPSAKRQTAYKLSVSEMLGKKMNEGDEWQPSYIEIGTIKASRVNMIGIVVSKEENGFAIDDGTGTIKVKNFGTNQTRTDYNIGELVLVIGRLRSFNEERYISPEITRKSTEKEKLMRMLEHEKDLLTREETVQEAEIPEEEIFSEAMKIRDVIRQLDKGNGADIDDVEKNSNSTKTEELIRELMQAGEIFEVRPGRLKVLE